MKASAGQARGQAPDAALETQLFHVVSVSFLCSLYSDVFCAWRFAGTSWVTQLVCMLARKQGKCPEARGGKCHSYIVAVVKKSRSAGCAGSFLQKDWPPTHASVKSLACTGLCADRQGYQLSFFGSCEGPSVANSQNFQLSRSDTQHKQVHERECKQGVSGFSGLC